MEFDAAVEDKWPVACVWACIRHPESFCCFYHSAENKNKMPTVLAVIYELDRGCPGWCNKAVFQGEKYRITERSVAGKSFFQRRMLTLLPNEDKSTTLSWNLTQLLNRLPLVLHSQSNKNTLFICDASPFVHNLNSHYLHPSPRFLPCFKTQLSS